MTGVTSEEFSRSVLDWLIRTSERHHNFKGAAEGWKFAVQLLNSDYKMNTMARNEALQPSHQSMSTLQHLKQLFIRV
jgi:hypothetical protein